MAANLHAKGTAFVIDSDVELEDLGDGIRRKILAYSDELMMVRAWFEEGAVGTLHTHPHSQIAYVESGRFRASIDGQERELVAGDTYYAAPGIVHGAVCLEAGVLIDVFTPKRSDFLGEEACSC